MPISDMAKEDDRLQRINWNEKLRRWRTTDGEFLSIGRNEGLNQDVFPFQDRKMLACIVKFQQCYGPIATV